MDCQIPSQGTLVSVDCDDWNISVIIPEGRGADAITFAWTFHKMPNFGPQVIFIIRQHIRALRTSGGSFKSLEAIELNGDFRDFGIAFAAIGLLFYSTESVEIVEHVLRNGQSAIEIGISDSLVRVILRTATSTISFDVAPPFNPPGIH